MSTLERLKAQNWATLQVKVTKFAYAKTGKRSLEVAEDLTQQAILKTFEHPESWDPDKETILKHVCLRVFSLLANHRASKRNAFERAIAYDVDPDQVAPEDYEAPEEADDRRRLAESYRARIGQANQGDDAASDVVDMMIAGDTTPAEQVRASRYTIDQIRDARRRVFYRADQVSEALGRELDEENDDDEVAE